MEEITVNKVDYNLLVGQNEKLKTQNKTLQEQLLQNSAAYSKLLKAYCTLVAEIVENESDLKGYFTKIKVDKDE